MNLWINSRPEQWKGKGYRTGKTDQGKEEKERNGNTKGGRNSRR